MNSEPRKIVCRWLLTASLACLLSSLPLSLHILPGWDLASITPSEAAAKGGSGSSGGSGSGGSGSGGSGSSGSGSGGGGSGSGGSSGGSGKSGGGDDHSNSGSGRGEQRGHEGQPAGIGANAMEIVYPGGWKETIREGRFAMRDPSGRIVVERSATSEDFARFRAAAP